MWHEYDRDLKEQERTIPYKNSKTNNSWNSFSMSLMESGNKKSPKYSLVLGERYYDQEVFKI